MAVSVLGCRPPPLFSPSHTQNQTNKQTKIHLISRLGVHAVAHYSVRPKVDQTHTRHSQKKQTNKQRIYTSIHLISRLGAHAPAQYTVHHEACPNIFEKDSQIPPRMHTLKNAKVAQHLKLILKIRPVCTP